MALVCQNPARDRHEIGDGARKITLTGIVFWGTDDLRAEWQGDYVFCSFQCCSEWAAARASDHDGIVLRDGEAVEALTPEQVTALEPVAATPVPVDPVPVTVDPAPMSVADPQSDPAPAPTDPPAVG